MRRVPISGNNIRRQMMVKKRTHVGGLFPRPDPHDPIGNFVAGGLNIIVNAALKRFSYEAGKFFGVSGLSPEQQIALNRSRVALVRQELELTKAEALGKMQIRLLEIRIAEKEAAMERSRQAIEEAEYEKERLQLPAKDTVIIGALEVVPDAGGLTGSPEQLEAYNRWLDSLQEGKVIVITGSRGSGKTCLGAKIAEFVSASYKMPVFWVGLPPEGRQLVPNWVSLANDPSQCPVGSLILVDEAGLEYCATLFSTSHNRFMSALLMISRQRHCSLIFCVQSTADIDLRILRQADSVIFKQLSLNQVETERPSVRKRAARADLAFKGMSKMECLESAYICDKNWEGIIQFSPPSFWSESLSYVYAYKDLTEIRQQVSRQNELQKIVTNETHQLTDASLDTKILELRKDHGIDAIAKKLGLTQHRVRKCLNEHLR
jgi:hypothetical protein